MKAWISLVGLSVSLVVSASARAQQTAIVQLPTFSYVTVNTTVSVPDSGRAFMGGVHRRRSAKTSRGLPWISGLPAARRLARSRAISAEAAAGGVAASATIMDLKEMDDAVLAAAEGRGGTVADHRALRLTARVDRDRTSTKKIELGGSLESVAGIRRQNAREDAKLRAELIRYWKMAQAAEAAGRLGSARCNYKIVARRGSGRVRNAVLAKLKKLEAQPSPPVRVAAKPQVAKLSD